MHLKWLHNIAFTWIIIPDAKSTASAQSTGATGVSSPPQQSAIGASATATPDKSETTTGTQQYKNNIEKYKTTVKA